MDNTLLGPAFYPIYFRRTVQTVLIFNGTDLNPICNFLFDVEFTAGKVMASVFWDAEGILFIDYLEKGKTITGEYYSNLLTRLEEKNS
jgi:hypothetical protein